MCVCVCGCVCVGVCVCECGGETHYLLSSPHECTDMRVKDGKNSCELRKEVLNISCAKYITMHHKELN